MVKHPANSKEVSDLIWILVEFMEKNGRVLSELKREFDQVRAWLWKRHRWVWFWEVDTLEDMVDAFLALKWRYNSIFLNFDFAAPFQSFLCNTWLPFSEMNALLNRSSP